MKTTITNEFGNSITIEVAKPDAFQTTSHLVIRLTGPTSASENFITNAEADTLLTLLAEFRGFTLSR